MSADAVPRWAPHYGAGPGSAFRRFWTGYIRFSGRASRAEFWWWALMDAVIAALIWAVASTPLGATGALVAVGLWAVVTLVPGLALAARRMHDLDLSAWVLLAALIPTLGAAALLIVAALPPNAAGARFDRPDADDPHVPEVPGGDTPARDYGWPPLPLPYAGPAGGQPLFDDPPDEDERS